MSQSCVPMPVQSTAGTRECDCLTRWFGNAADYRLRERRYPSDMTDAEWVVVRPLLPVPGWMQGLDTLGLLLGVLVTAADVGDRAAAHILLEQVAVRSVIKWIFEPFSPRSTRRTVFLSGLPQPGGVLAFPNTADTAGIASLAAALDGLDAAETDCIERWTPALA